MDIILFGMQGSGKGTLGKALAEKYNLIFFETGAELRKLAQSESALGKKIKSIIEAGHLVSNEVVMQIVENFLKNLETNNQYRGILFDGIPRKTEQAESLNQLLKNHNRDYKAIFLDIKKETALQRIAERRKIEQRADDTDEALAKRLQAYEQETLPTIALYSQELIRIDGEPPIEKVRQNAFEILDQIWR